MCGRTCLTLNKDQITCACSYKRRGDKNYSKPEWLHEHNDGKEFVGSYNIAPTDVSPVLVSGSKFKNATESDRIVKPMMWSVIPPWHKGDYKTHSLSTNNCRLENIKTSKLYNPLLNNGGRCVIIVEGFYEWQTTQKTKVKQPYYIYAPQKDCVKVDEPSTWKNINTEDGPGMKLLHIAGLYNVWQDNNKVIYSYSVITMESNSTLSWLHHRMPAILDSEDQISAWLDIDKVNPDMAISLLKPSNSLTWHRVSSNVNNSRNKSEECNKRITETTNKSSQKTLTTWFTKAEKRKSEENQSDSKRIKI